MAMSRTERKPQNRSEASQLSYQGRYLYQRLSSRVETVFLSTGYARLALATLRHQHRLLHRPNTIYASYSDVDDLRCVTTTNVRVAQQPTGQSTPTKANVKMVK